MAPVGDNLAARITAILLGSFLALSLLVLTVMVWPKSGEDRQGLFQLPVPEETAAIVAAVEASPPEAKPLVLRALNTSVASVHIERDFLPAPLGLRRARDMEWMFSRYSHLLGDRPFRVDMRAGPFSTLLSLGDASRRLTVRLSVRLRDGSVLVMERRPPAIIRNYIARIAAIAGAAALILIAGLALAVRQTARPVAQLALAARRFSIDGAAPDLPLSGPRELRDLSTAFNDLQHRIRGLVDDRTRVLAAIAHDLRTYLTRLRLRAEFISDDDQRERAARDIEDMSLLLDDTLLFAQQATLPHPDAEILDLALELQAFAAVRREIDDPVTLDPEGLASALPVRCNALAFRRMLDNLVDNAIRYGGAAHLAVRRSPQIIEVFVDDEGPGVPAEDLARLIKPFERLEASRGLATGGAGLGLAIVKALVESCGGRLTIENRQPTGLRGIIELPASVSPAV